jgi:serine phosphatase RsbU (regulator of sigma subunit)
LWVSTFGFISKAYVNIPVTCFSEKQGIEAGLNSIAEFNGSLYLGNDVGVYKSAVNKQNEVVFGKIQGVNDQVFPIKKIASVSGDFLLVGSWGGIKQILKNDIVKDVEQNCINLPDKRFNIKTRKILQSQLDPSVVYLGLEAGGLVILKFNGKQWEYISKVDKISQVEKIPGNISGIVEKKGGGVWFLTDDPSALYSAAFGEKDTVVVKYGPEKGIPDIDLVTIHNIGDKLYLTTSGGILRYFDTADRFVPDNGLTGDFSVNRSSINLFADTDGDIWYSEIDGVVNEILFRKNQKGVVKYDGIFRILPNVISMDMMYSEGKVYILKAKSVYVVDKSGIEKDTSLVNTSFVKIIAGTDSVVMDGSFYTTDLNSRRIPSTTNPDKIIPSFGFDMNEISFQWTTPSFTEELFTEYSYRLEGFETEWSKWEGISFGNTMVAQYSKKEYTNLPYGRYTFKVRTRTLVGQTGKELSYEFIILKPWYATIFAFAGFVLVAFLIIISIIKAYTKKLKNENIRLEGIVAERTAVVVKQKEELESSIHYASRIQMALLPSEAILSENIKNYFVLFKPRDIVSGDFYWMTKKGERLYIVAGDCTGHGVPGAFMSLLGMSFLDEIIDKEFAPRADLILKELRLHVTESLKQVGGDDEAKDGMDLALLVIDFDTQKIEFSGAYNPCFRVRKLTEQEIKNYASDENEMADGSMSNGKYLLETIYASKMPIGISSRMNEDFVFYESKLERGISYYLFSDGYIDQFGGPNGRKFMKKNFKRFILDIQDYPMKKQKELLDRNLIEWMGHSPQIDDILVMGIRTE